MIEQIIPLLSSPGASLVGSIAGGFFGNWIAWKMNCPNRRCCQLKKIRQEVEG